MNDKPKIKPMHLVLAGVAIIILGILVPSIFIDAFSTIGLSIIIGILMLLSAYVFLSINTVRSKGSRSIKWLLIPPILIGLSVGSYYTYHSYQQNLENKIYSIDETIDFDDFNFSITSAKFDEVDLQLDKKLLAQYGLEKQENCDNLSNEPNWTVDFHYGGGSFWSNRTDPSDKDMCIERNQSRSAILEYLDNNKTLTVSFQLAAKNTVNTDDFKITLMPDSGRNPNKKLFDMNNGPRYSHVKSNETHEGITRSVYEPVEWYPIYRPYGLSGLDGIINKGLSRDGHIGADIRDSEKNVDIKISYKDATRIYRITR